LGKSAVNYKPSSWTAGAGHFQIKRKNIPAEVRWDNSTEEVEKTYAKMPNNTTYSKFSDSRKTKRYFLFEYCTTGMGQLLCLSISAL